jgi:hypothetical protein
MANMKKLFIIVMVIGLTFTAVNAFAQSAKEAVFGLKKLQARCQSGISYHDYSNALADAKLPVSLFMESADAKKYSELTDSLNKVMKHYEYAGNVWNAKFKAPSDDMLHSGWIWDKKAMGREIKELYPNVTPPSGWLVKYYSVDLVLSTIWETASKELENTTKLYAIIEGDTSNDIDKLKKENEKLKIEAESEKLKAENENLKKELELLKSKKTK